MSVHRTIGPLFFVVVVAFIFAYAKFIFSHKVVRIL